MATPTGSTPVSGSHVNSGQGGGSPPIPAATPEKWSLDTKPSFIFKTSEGVGGDADVSLPLPLAPADSPRLPMPNGSKPGVGSKQASPTFFEETDSSSEDVQSDEEGPAESKIKAKTADKPAEPEKKRRTPSVILETHPRLGDLPDAEFVASEESNSGAEREKPEKPAPNLVGGATEDMASSEEVEAALDSILADYKKPSKQALSAPPSSTASDSHSGSPATKTNAKNVANPSAAKENEPVPRSSQDTSPQSVSTSTPEASKPGSSKLNKRASATISNAVPPATPAPSSSTTPPSSARVRKLDSFTSIRSKKTEVAIDGEQSPEPEKRTKLKKSPRPEKSDRAKRRSQRMPALTLQPRYVPDTGDRDVSARSRATLEQCRGLLQLLEAGCDKELRWQLLGALVGMAFELPKESRAEVLERSWRYARALPDAQLRQWAHQVLSRYYEAKGSDDDDSSDESGESHNQSMQDFTALCREVKLAATGKKWNELVSKIARSKLGDPAKLIATAVAIDSVKDLKDKAAIGDAMSALKNKLGAKLLVLAFFQSSACPGATRLRMEIAHTASAVLRGILAGDPEAIEDFKTLVNIETIPKGVEKILLECMNELAPARMPRQSGNASPAPTTTDDDRGATSTSTAPTNGTIATPGAVAASEPILDIVRELLLLEGQSDMPGATKLPDRSICHLISVLELEHETALRAIDEVAYDDAVSFIHGVCASTLTPLSCQKLLSDIAPGEGNQPELPLLQHLMVSGNIHVAREYLGKLDKSDMPKTDLISLLSAVNGSGPSALESAISLGRDDNISGFIDIVAGLRKLNADEKLALLEAKRRDGTPGLLGAIKSGGTQMEKSVYAYMTGLLQFDKKLIREVIDVLSAPDKDSNSPLRLALMKDDAGLVFGMVCAICEDDTLAPDEKAALLSGQTSAADGIADYRETALTAYYLAVKAKYQEKNPGGKIPKSKSADGDKIIYFESVQDQFGKPYAGQDQDAKQLRSEARQESLHAMMSQLTANDREQLKREGQRLMREAQAGAVSAFHAALRHGKAQSVAGFIKATIEYAKSGSQVRPINFILANDASGNSALFNAMANDEASAVEAYVDAVLASALPFTDKERLLLQQGEVMAAATPKKYSPLQVAMVSLNYRAMQAYIAAVLRSSLADDDKQQLLLAVGGNGKSARDMVAEFARKAPQTHGKCLQMFDEMITASKLSLVHKRYLTQAYNAASAAKKS